MLGVKGLTKSRISWLGSLFHAFRKQRGITGQCQANMRKIHVKLNFIHLNVQKNKLNPLSIEGCHSTLQIPLIREKVKHKVLLCGLHLDGAALERLPKLKRLSYRTT